MPFFKHYCKECIYLGEVDRYELYYCPMGKEHGAPESLIAKWGDDPGEQIDTSITNAAGLILEIELYEDDASVEFKALAMAYAIAVAKGFIRLDYEALDKTISEKAAKKERPPVDLKDPPEPPKEEKKEEVKAEATETAGGTA